MLGQGDEACVSRVIEIQMLLDYTGLQVQLMGLGGRGQEGSELNWCTDIACGWQNLI